MNGILKSAVRQAVIISIVVVVVGLGFWVSGLGLRVQGVGVGFSGHEFRVWGSGFRF